MIHPAAIRLFAFVTTAFLAIITVWIVVCYLASGVDTHLLTPREEIQLLQNEGVR